MAKDKVILIVDDDVTLQEMYRDRLKEEGYIVITASDGKTAIKKAQQHIPALIVLDVMMPELNGIDTLTQLRADSKTKNIPVIILTALLQEVDKIKKVLTDKDSYLIKSKDMPKDVLNKVKKALEK